MALYLDGKRVVGNETKTLTWAEYQALSSAEKNNGTIYLLSDVNDEGQDNFQPIVYSADETEVGAWVNGKPLYRKTFEFTSALTISTNWVATSFDKQDADLIVDSELIRIASLGPIAHCTNIRSGDTKIYLSTPTNNTGLDVGSFLTIWYTKSTDTAGSGTWSPQGVPSVHYSTDEQVVGTWIDGSTLYQKTFYSTTTVPYTTDVALVVNDTIPTGIEIVDLKARFYGVGSGTPPSKYTVADGHWFTIYHEETSNEFRAHQILTSGGLTSCMTYITIQYTKSST